MTTRMVSRQVTFNRPFVLDGFDRVEPAGSYTVETEEESLDEVSFLAWRRVLTLIHIVHGAETAYVRIDPEDLRKALARDEAQPEPEADTVARLEANRRRNTARLVRRMKY